MKLVARDGIRLWLGAECVSASDLLFHQIFQMWLWRGTTSTLGWVRAGIRQFAGMRPFRDSPSGLRVGEVNLAHVCEPRNF